jgi:hypothetical protein
MSRLPGLLMKAEGRRQEAEGNTIPYPCLIRQATQQLRSETTICYFRVRTFCPLPSASCLRLLISLFVANTIFIPCSNAQVVNNRELEFNIVNTSMNQTMFAPATPITSYSNVLKRVPLNDLLGNSTTPFEVIVPPSGVNISLIGSDWIIKKLWLDSPGFSLDFDGCLSKSGSSNVSKQSQDAGNCKSSEAQVIHIVPEENSNSSYSMLTLIVSSSSDSHTEKRKLLIIRLKQGQNSDYTAYNYEIYDNYGASISSTLISKKLNIIESIRQNRIYSHGIQVALNKKFISENGVLHQKLKGFLVNLREGETIENSANKAGVDLQIIQKIYQLGA